MHFREVIGENGKHGELERQKWWELTENGEEGKIVNQTEEQQRRTDCIDKNDCYKPTGMVKNNILSAWRYGSNDQV